MPDPTELHANPALAALRVAMAGGDAKAAAHLRDLTVALNDAIDEASRLGLLVDVEVDEVDEVEQIRLNISREL